MGAVRLIAFIATALGVELARGAGAATLILAAVIGAFRRHPLLLVATIVGGAAISLALPESETGGKVLHGLSNAPFVLLLYVFLAAIGYLAGRLVRRLRKP